MDHRQQASGGVGARRRVLRMEHGRLLPFADLSTHATGPCNDMVSDGNGRAWVGDIGFDWFAGAER
jgi:sugar lactone lactonase YvrE